MGRRGHVGATLARRARFHALLSLLDELIDDRLETSGAVIDSELPVGTRPFIKNPKRVLDFLATAEVIDDVIDEPLEHLADESARRKVHLLAEVDELAVETEACRAPLVLLDERLRVDAKRHVVTPQLPELRHHRLKDRGDAHRLVHARAHIAHAELEGRELVMRPNVPPDL
jgi:hypothetical protein